MCDPITALVVASAAISAGSAIQQGKQQKEWSNYQADQATADASAERSAATLEADKIRKMARIQSGQTTAALSASGVSVDEGTALNINKDIYRGAEEDAVMTIFGGNDRSARGQAEASGYKVKGSQAQTAGYLSAASTVLGAASNGGKGWKKAA